MGALAADLRLAVHRLRRSPGFTVAGIGIRLAFGARVTLLLAVAFLASWWPARRAGRLDPLMALRTE